MTTIDDTTTAQAAAAARIDSVINALLALRNLAAELPDIADQIIVGEYGSMRINIYVGDGVRNAGNGTDAAGRIARIVEAAERHGAVLATKTDHKYGGVAAMFGPFELYAYAPVKQVGTVAVREVTEWQLDERLAAFGTGAAA